MLDRYPEAEARYHEALSLYRQIGARLGEAGAMLPLGRLRRAEGRWGEAVANLSEGERLYHTLGVDRGAGQAVSERSAVEAMVGQGRSDAPTA